MRLSILIFSVSDSVIASLGQWLVVALSICYVPHQIVLMETDRRSERSVTSIDVTPKATQLPPTSYKRGLQSSRHLDELGTTEHIYCEASEGGCKRSMVSIAALVPVRKAEDLRLPYVNVSSSCGHKRDRQECTSVFEIMPLKSSVSGT